MSIDYAPSYCEKNGISTSDLNQSQRTLHFIAENMRMNESISVEGYEDFQKAISALSAEPCEDCISRQAVLDLLQMKYSGKELYMTIYNMPSVQPIPDSAEDNTMEWIRKPHIYGVTYCSKCDYENKVDDTKFCPNCGRKAVEE